MNPVPSDDTAHDAHLAAALRHAPDADVSAPPALGAALRQSARQAVAAGKPRPKATPFWQAWWQRPLSLGASGAFATLLIGCVTLWIWRGEVPPPVVDMRPAHEAADAGPAADAVAQAPAPATAPAPESAPPEAPAARQPPVQTAPADTARPSGRPRTTKVPDVQKQRPDPHVAPPPPAAEATVVAEAPAVPPAPAALPARPAPAMPAPAVPSPMAAAPAAAAVAPQPAAAPGPETADAAVARSDPASRSAKARAIAQLADQPATRPRAVDAKPGDHPWPDVLMSAAPGSLRLHGPQGPDAHAWLQRLRSTTSGRWRAVEAGEPGNSADDLLLHDDRGPVARLRLSAPGRLLICRVEPGACWQATLDDAVLRAWWAGAPR